MSDTRMKDSIDERSEYFNYLRKRSLAGLLYRRFWLYPRFSRYLSGHVLDIGCGIGDFLAYRPETVGVDVNPHAVKWCRQKGLAAGMMESDRLPFNVASFDGVVLDNVLEHLSDPIPLLAEIHRILVPSGHLLVGVPGKRGFAYDPDHKVFYDELELSVVMSKASFNQQALFHMPLKSDWMSQRLSQYCLYGVFLKD